MNHKSSLVTFLLVIFIVNTNAEFDELKMVHVIFRHGERTPTDAESGESYPTDPYANETFFPTGRGSLTNDGKLTMYNLGTFLRQRYDNFLGDLYYPGITRIRSTQSHRTMMSAELVTAGLWPPAEIQQWKADLLWMPIPYEYVYADTDSLMWSYKCPTYIAEYERVLLSDEVQALIEPYREFFSYLSEHTGLNITRPKQVFFLYHTLVSELNCNLTLPSWTEGYFPDGDIYDLTLLEYDIASWSEFLHKIYGGPLLYDILQEYKTFIENSSSSEIGPQITLYSGHESNICSVLKTLDLWTPHVPDFGSAVIFELHLDNSTNEYGIQILYYLGKSEEIVTLTLPGCTQICPIGNFTSLLSNVIPDNVEELCGMNTASAGNRSSYVSLLSILYITLEIWILLKTR